MAENNRATFAGILVRPPNFRYLPTGTGALELSLQGAESFYNSLGDLAYRRWYQTVTIFGARAERIAEEFTEGQGVLALGRLDYQAWETPDGKKRSKVAVIASEVHPFPIAKDQMDAKGYLAGVNRVELLGGLTKDAQVRQTQSSSDVLRVDLAVTESWKDHSGAWHERPHYFAVSQWDPTVNVAELVKGSRAYIVGSLGSRKDEKTDTRYYEISAKTITPLTRTGATQSTRSTPKPVAQTQVVETDDLDY